MTRVPLADIATPAQIQGLTILYKKQRFACPTEMEDSRYGRSLLGALVHPKPDKDGLPRFNQTRDVVSESMKQVFGDPARLPHDIDPRTLAEVFADAYAAVLAGKKPRDISNALHNRLSRESVKVYGSSMGWKSAYYQLLARAARERQEAAG